VGWEVEEWCLVGFFEVWVGVGIETFFLPFINEDPWSLLAYNFSMIFYATLNSLENSRCLFQSSIIRYVS